MRKKIRADDWVVLDADDLNGGGLPGILRRAFDLAEELAKGGGMTFPLTLSVLDAQGQCLVRVEMTLGQTELRSGAEPGEVEERRGLAFPWYVVVSDAGKGAVTVGFDLESAWRQRHTTLVQ